MLYNEGAMNPVFYMVATPIGNRDDITTRALQVLGDVDFIVAEDTRHTGELLAYLGIKKPLISFRDAPTPIMDRSLHAILERVNQGEAGAFVTDAGTPGVSDPGWRLVAELTQKSVQVIPVPGASAATSLLSAVHLPLDEYRFLGFLPKKKGYQTKLEDLKTYLDHKEKRAVIFYESPKRIRQTLTDLRALPTGFQVIIGRELTKKFETLYRSPLTEEFIALLPEKGEYVCLVAKA